MSPSPGDGGRRIGVFGGTFDPVHVGHLVVAQDVREALSLDRILFVPAGTPPHKDAGAWAPGDLRLRMLREVTRDEPAFHVSDVELRRSGPSFTVDTLRTLGEERPDDHLHFLMGADQWPGFASWREPAEVARLATLVVMTREGDGPVPAGVRSGSDGSGAGGGDSNGAASLDHLPEPECVAVTRIDLSSTGIRRRIAAGRSVRYRVPEAAHRIILREGLYG